MRTYISILPNPFLVPTDTRIKRTRRALRKAKFDRLYRPLRDLKKRGKRK